MSKLIARKPVELTGTETYMVGERKRSLFGKMTLTVILVFIILITLVPFLWMISASLKDKNSIFIYPIQWIPAKILWTNFKEIWMKIPLSKFITNTTVLALAITCLQVFTSSFAAYAFAKLKFKGRNVLFLCYMATIAVPWQAYMVPQFLMFSKMGMVNTLWSMIFLQAFSAFGVFMMRNFFMSIPSELCEAARIDGLSEVGIWFRIMLPNAAPAVATLTIYTFVTTWNDFLGPSIYLTYADVMTIQVGVKKLISQFTAEWSLIMAAGIVSMIPVLIVFIALQKYFVEGVVSSAVKG